MDEDINEWGYPLIPNYKSRYICKKCRSEKKWKEYLKMVRNLGEYRGIPWKIEPPNWKKKYNKDYEFHITYDDIKKNSDKFYLVDTQDKVYFIKYDLELFNKWLNIIKTYESLIDLNDRFTQSLRQYMTRYEYPGLDIETYLSIYKKEGFSGVKTILHKRTELLKAETIAHVLADFGIGPLEWKVHEPVIDEILNRTEEYINSIYIDAQSQSKLKKSYRRKNSKYLT
jgi:hypothetical protein